MSRPRSGRWGLFCCHNPTCGEAIISRGEDLWRSKRNFCTMACLYAAMRTGRAFTMVPCANCGVLFRKSPTEVRRSRTRHFCSRKCWHASADYAAMGRVGGAVEKAPLDPAFLRERARKGGLARAKALSPERLREIAALALEARRRMSPEEVREAQRRQVASRRFGPVAVLGVRLGRKA